LRLSGVYAPLKRTLNNMKRANVYLIGLTGNIACGKSSVLAMLAEHGAQVIDADRLTHELQQPGQPVYTAIVEAFGTGILESPNGPINRRALGAIVFNNPAELRKLEQIVHPAVRQRLNDWLAEQEIRAQNYLDIQPVIAVIDAIKLLESGWKSQCDAIWVVTCTPEQQIERLMAKRGMSEAEARARQQAQSPQSEKVAHATVVIDNSGTLEETRKQVDAAWERILASTQ